MAKWWDIPVETPRDLLRRILLRSQTIERRLPAYVAISVTIEEARVLWSAACWLDVATEGKSEDSDSTRRAVTLIKEINEQMKGQDGEERCFSLTGADLHVLSDVEILLDRYALTRVADEAERKRKRRGSRK